MRTVSTVPRTPNEQAALDYLRQRRQGYLHTFKKDDRFASIVLADLQSFCRAGMGQTTFDMDPRVSALLQGRYEVFQRILEHLNLTEEDLVNLKVKG